VAVADSAAGVVARLLGARPVPGGGAQLTVNAAAC
jgi:hypothetical protein